MESGDGEQGASEDSRASSVGRRLVVLLLPVCFLGAAMVISYGVTRLAVAVLAVGEEGTASRLLLSVLGLQLAGFGIVVVLFFQIRDSAWRPYLRLGPVTEWVVFYGTAVGLTLMVITAIASGVVNLFGIELTESTAGGADDPLHYVAVFCISTFLAVPMEEVFFRGFIQRRLEEEFHPGIAIGIASGLFVVIHTGIRLGGAGEMVSAGLFFSFGAVLGVSYSVTENLVVPLTGHLVFNSVQIIVRIVELTV